MRALVVGGDSKIGAVLCTQLLARGHEVLRTKRGDMRINTAVRRNERVVHLDMLEPALPVWSGGLSNGGTVVYIMAAITGIVPAEQHPDAWRVNAEGALQVAVQAKSAGYHVVFMSSGTVEKAPHTASAHQKTYVEGPVLMMGGCVVRPLPFVRPEWFPELADLLVDIGEQWRSGVVRWGADR